MRAKSPLEEKYIKVIARELAIGLESIHSIGVLHRDIKGKSTRTQNPVQSQDHTYLRGTSTQTDRLVFNRSKCHDT